MDIKVTRTEFLRVYNKELNAMFDNEDSDCDNNIYGKSITVHWNGIYCDCGDGATPSNYIIPAIEECDDELEEEDEEETSMLRDIFNSLAYDSKMFIRLYDLTEGVPTTFEDVEITYTNIGTYEKEFTLSCIVPNGKDLILEGTID